MRLSLTTRTVVRMIARATMIDAVSGGQREGNLPGRQECGDREQLLGLSHYALASTTAMSSFNISDEFGRTLLSISSNEERIDGHDQRSRPIWQRIALSGRVVR